MPLVLLDLDSACYRSAVLDTLDECRVAFDAIMRDTLGVTQALEWRGFIESPEWKHNFRMHVATSRPYKEGRPPRPPWLNDVKRHAFAAYAPHIVEVRWMESEDAMRISAEEHGLDDVIMCSIDKDVLQIPGLHYNYVKRVFQRVSPEGAARAFWKQMLVGDQCDTIPGLPKVGEKKAEKILDGIGSADMPYVVAREYALRGWPYSYMLEQARLLHLLRSRTDVYELPITKEHYDRLAEAGREAQPGG